MCVSATKSVANKSINSDKITGGVTISTLWDGVVRSKNTILAKNLYLSMLLSM